MQTRVEKRVRAHDPRGARPCSRTSTNRLRVSGAAELLQETRRPQQVRRPEAFLEPRAHRGQQVARFAVAPLAAPQPGEARCIDWPYLERMRQRLDGLVPEAAGLRLRKVWAATASALPGSFRSGAKAPAGARAGAGAGAARVVRPYAFLYARLHPLTRGEGRAHPSCARRCERESLCAGDPRR